MNITFGFLIIAISVVFPGLFCKKIFYFSEFSKQFSYKEDFIRTIIFSIPVGVAANIFCYLFYVSFIDPNFQIIEWINSFKILVNDNQIYNPSDKEFNLLSKASILMFIRYSSFVYLICGIYGFLGSRLIRVFKWDTRYKYLRYSNIWYYIFSSEILKFKKFKNGINLNLEDKTFLFSNVDVLIRENEQTTTLYSGRLIDYELDPKEINKLDKVILHQTYRWKYEQALNGRIKVPVPGMFFVIEGANILDINVNYVFYKWNRAEIILKKFRKNKVYRNTLSVIYLMLVPLFFYKLNFIENYTYNYYFKFSWISQILCAIIFSELLSLIIPFYSYKLKSVGKEIVRFVGFKDWFQTAFLSLIRLIIYCALIFIIQYNLFKV